MQSLPIFLNVQNRPCLVVGGGSIAARKIDLLLRAGADVTVVSPELGKQLQALRIKGDIKYLARPFQDTDVKGFQLVIAATDHVDVNRAVYESATRANIPVNVVDTPELCSFTFGAIIDRDPITIAVSSAGQSPVLTRAIRSAIESHIPAAFGKLAGLAGQYRDAVKKVYKDIDSRRRFWEKTLSGPIAEQVFAGNDDAAEKMLQALLSYTPDKEPAAGEVFLIGAGPGDPDLLTFRALRLLQKADIVFYDRLVSQGILDLARRDADRFYVGKKRDLHCVPQSEINELLVQHAKAGKFVARVKGGDPFIFGRGGEEAEALAAAGVSFQIVPGITAASACSAYAGIPLTHRDYAQAVRFITGHTQDGELKLDWASLITQTETLVFYMGLKNLGQICSQLIAHGLPDNYPVAVIANGATNQQQVATGTLSTITVETEKHAIQSPSLIIVGRVVLLREKLKWF